jgi:hypothetical protein
MQAQELLLNSNCICHKHLYKFSKFLPYTNSENSAVIYDHQKSLVHFLSRPLPDFEMDFHTHLSSFYEFFLGSIRHHARCLKNILRYFKSSLFWSHDSDFQSISCPIVPSATVEWLIDEFMNSGPLR